MARNVRDGVWYVNIGEVYDRSWNDRRTYGFISAGGTARTSSALRKLRMGDRLFAYVSGHGYVGYGEVTHECMLAADFVPDGAQKPLRELDLESPIKRNQWRTGYEEYAIGVHWIRSFTRGGAKRFPGAFANQNAVCRLRHPATLEFLLREFKA